MKKRQIRGTKHQPIFRADMPLDLDRGDSSFKAAKKEIKRTGTCWSEIMDLDRTIAAFVLPRLKKYRKEHFGIPNGLTNDPSEPHAYDESKPAVTFKDAQTVWNGMLDKMIWSFEEVCHGENDPVYVADSDMTREDYLKAVDDYEKRKQEGLHLFAEYLQALWW